MLSYMGKTKAPRGTDRSPEYKEHFCYKLDSRVKNVTTVFAKVFRFLPDIRSGKQIFFTSPNKNLPDQIKRADLVKKHK